MFLYGLGRGWEGFFGKPDKGLDWCGQPCRGLVEMGQHDCSEIPEEYTDIDVKRKFFRISIQGSDNSYHKSTVHDDFLWRMLLNPDP